MYTIDVYDIFQNSVALTLTSNTDIEKNIDKSNLPEIYKFDCDVFFMIAD